MKNPCFFHSVYCKPELTLAADGLFWDETVRLKWAKNGIH